MFGLRPQPEAPCGRGSPGASGALFGARLADPLDEESIDSPMRVVARDPRQTTIDNDADSLNGDGRLRDIRGNNNLRAFVLRDGLILIARRQFSMQRKQKVTLRFGFLADCLDRAVDFVRTRHEDEHVGKTITEMNTFGKCVSGQIPDWWRI